MPSGVIGSGTADSPYTQFTGVLASNLQSYEGKYIRVGSSVRILSDSLEDDTHYDIINVSGGGLSVTSDRIEGTVTTSGTITISVNVYNIDLDRTGVEHYTLNVIQEVKGETKSYPHTSLVGNVSDLNAYNGHYILTGSSVNITATTGTNITNVTSEHGLEIVGSTGNRGLRGTVSGSGDITIQYTTSSGASSCVLHIVSTSQTYTFSSVDRNHTINVTFVLRKYEVTFSPSDSERGSVSATSVAIPYNTGWTVSYDEITFGNGTVVRAIKAPNTSQYNYAFEGWQLDNGQALPVDGDAAHVRSEMHIVALFSKTSTAGQGTASNPLANITDIDIANMATASGDYYVRSGGTINVPKYNQWGVQIFAESMSPASGYGVSISNGGLVGTTTGDGYFDVVINAEQSGDGRVTKRIHVVKSYTVSMSVNDNAYGSVSTNVISDVLSGSTITVDGNQLTVGGTTITATNNTYYEFKGWRYYNTTTSVSTGDTISSNTSIQAYFEPVNFTITATAGPNGSINPSGSQTVVYNTSKDFNISANPGYVIDDIQIDQS